MKEQLDSIKEKFSKSLEDVQKTEIGQKGMQVGEEIGKTMKKTAETIASQGKQISESETVKAIGKVCKIYNSYIIRNSILGRPRSP